jgi:hypothetical protein
MDQVKGQLLRGNHWMAAPLSVGLVRILARPSLTSCSRAGLRDMGTSQGMAALISCRLYEAPVLSLSPREFPNVFDKTLKGD